MRIPKVEFKLLEGHQFQPVPIVADGSISSSGVLGGRLVPLVIIDTSARPDVEEFVRLHQVIQTPGDVKVQWGQIEGKQETVILYLTFIRPSEIVLLLEFNIVGQGILVDQAQRGKGLYIQAGRNGDRLKHDVQRPKVLVEIGDTGYQKIWEETWGRQLARHFREKGRGRSDSRRAAALVIQEVRAFGSLRIPDATT